MAPALALANKGRTAAACRKTRFAFCDAIGLFIVDGFLVR